MTEKRGVLAVALVVASISFAPRSGADSQADLLKRGQTLYAAHCARCHGDDGSDTSYPNIKPIADVTRRMSPREVIEKSKGFVAAPIEGPNAAALVAFLGTLDRGGYPRGEMLVDTAWVAAHGGDAGVAVVDVRSSTAYEAGHVPGARWLSEGPLRNEADNETYLPAPEAFRMLMEKAGITNQSHVVIYDVLGGPSAARLWYVLQAYGHERVSLMNGGWNQWVAEKRTVSKEPLVPAAPSRYQPKLTPSLTCPSTEVLARKPGVVVLDARSAAEYRGEQASGGGKGRIPGAVHVEWKENVSGDTLLFKPAAELKKLYESKGVTPDKEVVTYCASGGRAAHSLFALKLLGYPKVKVYFGSFSDYTRRNAPVEK